MRGPGTEAAGTGPDVSGAGVDAAIVGGGGGAGVADEVVGCAGGAGPATGGAGLGCGAGATDVDGGGAASFSGSCRPKTNAPSPTALTPTATSNPTSERDSGRRFSARVSGIPLSADHANSTRSVSVEPGTTSVSGLSADMAVSSVSMMLNFYTFPNHLRILLARSTPSAWPTPIGWPAAAVRPDRAPHERRCVRRWPHFGRSNR